MGNVGQEVTSVRVEDPYRFVSLGDGTELGCHALLIATGVSVRQLDVPGIKAVTGAGVYYGAALTEAAHFRDQQVYVVGGANSAGQGAMFFSGYASQVSMLVRGDSIEAEMSPYLVDQINATENIEVLVRTEVVEVKGEDRLEAITICDNDKGETKTVPAAAMFIFVGAAPHTDLGGRGGGAKRGRLHPHGGGPDARRPPSQKLEAEAGPVHAGDQRTRHIRGRRRSVRHAHTRSHSGGAGRNGCQLRSPVPEDGLMFDFLKKVPLFADLSKEDLLRLCQDVDELHLSKGDKLVAEGSTGDQAYVIKEGQLEVLKVSSGRAVLLAVRQPGEVIGDMALLEEAPRMASVRARTNSVVLAIHKKQLDELLHTSRSAAHAMFRVMLSRLRETEATLRQSEKMAQLGTLTAGVARELNNPAAAVKRGADQSHAAITRLEEAQTQLGRLDLNEEQQQALEDRAQRAQDQATRPQELDALARSDREYELETWLEERDVADAWELAPTMVNLDYDDAQLAALARDFDPDQLPVVIGWLNATYAVHNLLTEVGQGAGRISDIVKAIKSYSYLDQAPV